MSISSPSRWHLGQDDRAALRSCEHHQTRRPRVAGHERMGADDKRSAGQRRHGPSIGGSKGAARGKARSPGANTTRVNHLSALWPRPIASGADARRGLLVAGRRHAAGILGQADRCGLLGGPVAHRASMRPAMQAFPPVSRCAAGALDRDTGQAGWGKWGDEPRLTPNSASCRVRFRFAAGEPKVERTLLAMDSDRPPAPEERPRFTQMLTHSRLKSG